MYIAVGNMDVRNLHNFLRTLFFCIFNRLLIQSMELFIKNMVCDRCLMAVKNEFDKLGLTVAHMELGIISLQEADITELHDTLAQNLKSLGFELMVDKKEKTVERIKNLIVELIHQNNDLLRTNLSQYLAEKLDKDYNSLSSLFRELEDTTIEKFYITQRIERVKELLSYDELNLNEIALQLHYSSVAHLSNQFKKTTGLSPSAFKKQLSPQRVALDKL